VGIDANTLSAIAVDGLTSTHAWVALSPPQATAALEVTPAGISVPLVPPAVVISRSAESLNDKGGTPPFVAVERSGVMLNEKITSAERATLIGLVEVTLRTDESARLRYLNAAEVADVLSKGAHGCKEPVVMGEKLNSSADIKELDEERTASAASASTLALGPV
jgi:hypothetical protein